MASPQPQPLERPKVLVVEDEFIIALDLSETVKDLGYELEGPYAGNEDAFEGMGDELPDLAILDVFTADGEVYPLADKLSAHVPPEEVKALYPDAQACAKPCPPDRIIGALQEAAAKAQA